MENNEIFAKLKEAKSADELIEIAKANGAEITAEEASEIFEKLYGELSDDDLEKIADVRFHIGRR